MCPQCNKPLLGSASRGKSGKRYPAYHCNKRGHNFRVSKQELEARVDEFIGGIKISPDKLDEVFSAIQAAWEQANAEHRAKIDHIDSQIEELQGEISVSVNKLKVLTSETAIKYMEEDLMKIEKKIESLQAQKEELKAKKPMNITKVLARARYFAEHMDELLVKQIDPIRKARFFGVLFDKAPNYEDIKGRKIETPLFTGVNPIFALASSNNTSFGESQGTNLETSSTGCS